MLPLQSIAMGLLVVALSAPAGGYDVLADPLGWVLVLLGVARVPEGRGPLLALAGIALVVATALWFPAVREPLVGGDPALTWGANLPQLAFTAALLWRLRADARASGDVRAMNWLRTALVAVVVIGLAPAVVFGGGVASLAAATYVAAGFAIVLVIVLLFAYARRSWAPSVRTG
ncbi:hypothetical protein [uncultured Nocardioides sp.]|uniref:hypothetical protein n=1 Tax=uncultured Nocardioides sp. TaxID=198441 RepID=UPI002602F6DD|nr:hypothetical protein [uncultured Nocardioides sp.]